MPSVPHPTVFVRREVYERVGLFRLDLTNAMDYEWLLRVTRQGVDGRYLPEILAGMQLGGVSDRRFAAGYREVMRVSVAYGYGRLPARCRYQFLCLKGISRRGLEKCGLGMLARWFRAMTGSRYRYRS
jgi:hypothetical protein